jgi:hypothetical protein
MGRSSRADAAFVTTLDQRSGTGQATQPADHRQLHRTVRVAPTADIAGRLEHPGLADHKPLRMAGPGTPDVLFVPCRSRVGSMMWQRGRRRAQVSASSERRSHSSSWSMNSSYEVISARLAGAGSASSPK